MGVKNVTITVEDSALEWARIEAARRNTSVSRMLGEFLEEVRRRDDAYERAYQEWRSHRSSWKSDGSVYPRRDESYTRVMPAPEGA